MEETDIAWLAGLLEGEGCFRYKPRGKAEEGKRATIGVVLKMTDRDVVERAAVLMAGRVVRERPPSMRPTHSTAHTTCVYGQKAERVMRLVRPYMGQRRGAKIDELLALTNLSHHPRQKEAA